MREGNFTGTGKVFAFTLKEHYKSKATVITLLIMMLLAFAAFPVIKLVRGGNDDNISDEAVIKELFVKDETEYGVDFSGFAKYKEDYSGVEIKKAPENYPYILHNKAEDENSAALIHIKDYGDERVYISVTTSENSNINDYEIEDLISYTSDAIIRKRLETAGVSEKQIEIISTHANVKCDTVEEFTKGESGIDQDSSYFVTYFLSAVILFLAVYSSAYIVRAIAEEKTSKLVELLMVSIKPLALMVGKILAVMCFIVIGAALIIASSIFSYYMFADGSISINDILSGMSIDVSSLKLGIQTVPVLVVSFLLGYMTFALISGLSGACCSTTEDMQSANSASCIFALLGYTVALVGGAAFDSRGFAVFSSLCPFVSVFSAPSNYICGRIGLPLLLLSFAIQLAMIAALMRLTSKVYRELIMYKGERIKFFGLFGYAKKLKTSGKEGN